MFPCTVHFGARTLTVYVYLNENGELSADMDGRACIVTRSKKGFVCVKVRGGHGFPTLCDERYNTVVATLRAQLKIERKSEEYCANTRRLTVVPILNSETPHMTNVFRLTFKSVSGAEYYTKSGDRISEIVVYSNEAGLCVESVHKVGRGAIDISKELDERPEEKLKLEDITDYDLMHEATSGVDASWSMLCLDAYDSSEMQTDSVMYANAM